MAEITSEQIFEMLKDIQQDVGQIRETAVQSRSELLAVRTHLNAIQLDIHTIYEALARQNDRLERIERRLNLPAAH